MTPFEKFMLQAQGRDPDLEEKLRAEQFRNIERYFRIVFGRSLRPDERQLVESIASALNTSVDDEYVMQIFIAGRGLEPVINLPRRSLTQRRLLSKPTASRRSSTLSNRPETRG